MRAGDIKVKVRFELAIKMGVGNSMLCIIDKDCLAGHRREMILICSGFLLWF